MGAAAAGAPFRSPRLTSGQAAKVAEMVRGAALQARSERRVEEVVRAIAAAAERLADPASAEGSEAVALLDAELGWPAELSSETLGGMADGWTEEALRRLIESELGDLRYLDGFQPEPPGGADRAGDGANRGRWRRAGGPPLLFQVHAGNVPGVAITGVIRGLLARSGVLAKLPEDEPGLLVLFARAVARQDPLLGRSMAATWWPGSTDTPAWGEWVKRAGKVVVYGGEEAVSAVRSRVTGGVEVLAYGPRVGVAVVFAEGPAFGESDAATRSAAPGEDARRLARDVCAYEQQGCVSPRLVYVVGGPVRPFAARLERALAEEVARIPRPRARPVDAVAIRSMRAAAELRGYAEGGEEAAGGVLGAPEDLSWTVVWSERPSMSGEALPRVVHVYPARDVSELLEILSPLEGRIQAVGYAGGEGSAELAALAEGAAKLGVSRLTPVGRMAWPPVDWRHDGRHQLLPLLRWTDWESAD